MTREPHDHDCSEAGCTYEDGSPVLPGDNLMDNPQGGTPVIPIRAPAAPKAPRGPTTRTLRALIRVRNAAGRLIQAIDALRPADVRGLPVTTRIALSAVHRIAKLAHDRVGEALGG